MSPAPSIELGCIYNLTSFGFSVAQCYRLKNQIDKLKLVNEQEAGLLLVQLENDIFEEDFSKDIIKQVKKLLACEDFSSFALEEEKKEDKITDIVDVSDFDSNSIEVDYTIEKIFATSSNVRCSDTHLVFNIQDNLRVYYSFVEKSLFICARSSMLARQMKKLVLNKLSKFIQSKKITEDYIFCNEMRI